MFVRHYCWLCFRIYMYTYSCITAIQHSIRLSLYQANLMFSFLQVISFLFLLFYLFQFFSVLLFYLISFLFFCLPFDSSIILISPLPSFFSLIFCLLCFWFLSWLFDFKSHQPNQTDNPFLFISALFAHQILSGLTLFYNISNTTNIQAPVVPQLNLNIHFAGPKEV